MMRGDGQVSRSVTTGALPVIVTGGFCVFFFIEVSGWSGLFCMQEEITEMAINKKHLPTKVWYDMFIGLCILFARQVDLNAHGKSVNKESFFYRICS